jgi:hypothetical protein
VDRNNQRVAGFEIAREFSHGRPNKSESFHYFEDNLPQELLFEQFITDIADGANKMDWNRRSGLFLYHQTVRKPNIILINIPATQQCNDIDINLITAKVLLLPKG